MIFASYFFCGGIVRYQTARYDIKVDEERAERIIDNLRLKSARAMGLYQFVSRKNDAVQRRFIPRGVTPGDLSHRRWLYPTTMTDRREESPRVYESHVQLQERFPQLYTQAAGEMQPSEIEKILRAHKVGSPAQSAGYWPRCVSTLYGVFGGEPLAMYERGGGLIDGVLKFKYESSQDPIPGFGPKILSLYALYLAELGLMRMPPDAFPVDVHVQRFVISTGIVKGRGELPSTRLEQIARPLLCRVSRQLAISPIELSHDIWFLGHHRCTDCYRSRDIPDLCPVYDWCGGAIDTWAYYHKGKWFLDEQRRPRGGDIQAHLPWFEPLAAAL